MKMARRTREVLDAREYSRRLDLFRSGGFTQVPPGGREYWDHVDYSNTVGFVLFRHKETGAECACPNIWYNQPVEARIEYYRFVESENVLRRKHWEASKDPGAHWHLKDIAKHEINIAALIATMEETGKVIA